MGDTGTIIRSMHSFLFIKRMQTYAVFPDSMNPMFSFPVFWMHEMISCQWGITASSPLCIRYREYVDT